MVKHFFSSNDPFITRQLDPEEEEATEMRCRCERCGRPIRVKIGAEKMCILCIAEEKREK